MKHCKAQGFSLIATITMMVLLSLIAVGILSLSTIVVRGGEAPESQAIARVNAKLALQLALGELQEALGPDKRISANSDILGTNVLKRNLVGVWDSWDLELLSSPDYDREKEQRFRRWLVSTPEFAMSGNLGFAESEWGGDRVELFGNGALGPAADEDEKSFAQLVQIRDGNNQKTSGAYAWHITDETQKAKVNVYRDPEVETLGERTSLAGGHRPAARKVVSLDGTPASFLPGDATTNEFDKALGLKEKLISIEQFSRLEKAGDFKPFRNVLTPYSQGLLTNVRGGGLKKDLSLALGKQSLPDELEQGNGKIYASLLDITGESDPYWSRIRDYHNLYKDVEELTLESHSDEVYDIDVNREDSGISAGEDTPKSYPVTPALARVDIYLSAVVRDRVWRDSRGMHINVCPVVTLINPYNHKISFKQIKFEFNNIPIGVRVFMGGNTQRWYNPRLVPIGKMANARRGESDLTHYNSDFTLHLGDWRNYTSIDTSDATNGDITLEPGQSMLFSPYQHPRSSATSSLERIFADQKWGKKVDNNRNARTLKLAPGFRGLYSGDERLDMNPVYIPYSEAEPTHWEFLGYPLHMQGNDQAGLDPELFMQVGFVDDPKTEAVRGAVDASGAAAAPKLGGPPQTTFSLSYSLTSSSGSEQLVGGYEYDFHDKDEFNDLLNMPEQRVAGISSRADNPGRALRFPNVDRRRNRLYASDYYQSLSDRYINYNRARTFARFTLAAKNTRGGVYETDSREAARGAVNVLKDGQLASKPFLNENFVVPLPSADLSQQRRGGFPYEMSLVTYGDNQGEVEDDLEISLGSEAPVLTGNTAGRAQRSGSIFDLPTAPLTAISDFRRANVLASQHPPYTTHPVANSKVPALIPTDQVVYSNESGQLLDHSFLFNHAVYDNFFFSSIAEHSGRTAGDHWSDFLTNEEPLLARSLQPYFPDNQDIEQAIDLIDENGTAYREVAQFLMTKAPFNVNSTKVEAWKAVLSSLSDTEITYYDSETDSISSLLSQGAPLLGLNFPSGMPTDDVAPLLSFKERAAHWNGYRTLDEDQIERLAEEIVRQVRLRGPFLSFSEFVNRQIGPNSESTRMGALEAAIEAAELNGGMFSNQVEIDLSNVEDDKNFDYQTPEVLVGNPAEGAPSWLMQGDVMKVLEPGGTVRSDTFVIRTLGQARDSSGQVIASAYAEAVVQRYPDFVDNTNEPDVEFDSLTPINEDFGRKFRITSFRWLSPEEV